ncbi:MAG: hypothetical protein PHQ94_09170 [Syntrophomonas sp.]|nr:hypothetical protein [Syntrophomonas sp.]
MLAAGAGLVLLLLSVFVSLWALSSGITSNKNTPLSLGKDFIMENRLLEVVDFGIGTF